MLILLLIAFPSGIMKSFPSLLVWVLTTIVITTLTTTVASTVLFDNLLTANAQPQQLNTSQSVTQQQEGVATTRQGTITSSQNPIPGHEQEQQATILPFRQDGSIYTGVLTYTATEPVDVVILNMQTLNQTERSILNATEDGEFGTLITAQLDDQTSLVITPITPTYGGDSPAPSASIPFAGNAVWLHTPDGTPFAASYAVSAEVLPSEIMNNMSSPVETTDTVTPEDGEEVDVADTEDTDAENTTAATDTEGGAEEEAEGDDAGANEEVIVRIPQGASELTDDAYTPNPVEVNVGDTVTWINDDLTTHTSTSGSSSSGSTGMFGGTDDSPEIIGPEGDTQSFTFDEVGQFEYYCTLHPNMVGTVVVTEG
jgi:plastocyanin